MSSKIWALVFVFVVAASGCTKKGPAEDTPQRALSEYVGQTFAVTSSSDKKKLFAYLTGDAKQKLEDLQDAAFEQYFIESKKEFVSLKIKDERKLPDDRYSITYEITYNSKGPKLDPLVHDPALNRVVNKKHAVFVHQNGKWLISEIQNLKTLIELKEETTL